MAMSFPLSLTQFFDLLPIASGTLDLPENVQTSTTRGGEILRAELGTRLWEAELRLGPMTPDETANVLPMLNLLRSGAGTFLTSDPTRLFPRLDPTGQRLGSSAPKLASIAPNARDITISGLPSGYVLSRRDLVAFTYGTGPVRYALHEVVTSTATANASGVTGTIEVQPPIRPGAAVGAAITLKKPTCKAVIVPGSFQPGSMRSGLLTEGVSFRIKQNLR